MPAESCFHNKNEKNKHRTVLDGWIKFIKESKSEFVEFYIVKNYISNNINNKNNDYYRFLYSSLLAKSAVRFNIYKYEEDGSIVSGIGDLIESKRNENSLYDIVERSYTDAWNDRIGVRKINIRVWIQRFIVNHLYWILFSIIMLIGAIILCKKPNFSQDFFGNFISIMSIIGFLLSLCKQKITKLFRKEKLPF